jgi:hypothetical protein
MSQQPVPFVPQPPPSYQLAYMGRLAEALRNALTFSIRTDQAVSQVLLRSPNGTIYKVEVDNTGTLTATVV